MCRRQAAGVDLGPGLQRVAWYLLWGLPVPSGLPETGCAPRTETQSRCRSWPLPTTSLTRALCSLRVMFPGPRAAPWTSCTFTSLPSLPRGLRERPHLTNLSSWSSSSLGPKAVGAPCLRPLCSFPGSPGPPQGWILVSTTVHALLLADQNLWLKSCLQHYHYCLFSTGQVPPATDGIPLPC